VALGGDGVEVAGEGHGFDCYPLAVGRSVDLPVGEAAADLHVEALLAGQLQKRAALEETVVVAGRVYL
jgi:hypothetical protein